MKRITYLAPVSQLLSLNNTSMRFKLPILIVLLSGFSLSLSAQTVVDFTTMSDADTWGQYSQKDMGGGIFAMWGGDLDGDGIVSYDGTSYLDLTTFINYPTSPGNSDLLTYTFNGSSNNSNSRTYTSREYQLEDMDLDGIVAYDGTSYLDLGTFINYPTDPGNAWLLTQIFNHPLNTTNSRTFTFRRQLPD